MRTQFTRSSRRHKIGRAHALFVMNAGDPVIGVNGHGEETREWVGIDDRGVELQIGGFVVDDGETLLITHVMPAYRPKKRK